MPLPLPNLDTRRWNDLVDEGRTLIPRYAPGWTDHNIHDPGITLIEMFAWLVEQDIYCLNRVPDRHRRKFLNLLGFGPRPPQPAETVLCFTLDAKSGPFSADIRTLPAGVGLVTSAAPTIFYTTLDPLTVVAANLVALQVFDDVGPILDRTRACHSGLPFPLLGPDPQLPNPSDPERSPAFYLGFDQALPKDETVSIYLHFQGPGTDRAERALIIREAEEQAAACRPILSWFQCPPADPDPDGWCEALAKQDALLSKQKAVDNRPILPPHPAVRTVWEYFDGKDWRPLIPSKREVLDDTRSLTLDGAVRIRLPEEMKEKVVGHLPDPYFYLRCRLEAGSYDAAPVLLGAAVNSVVAEQSMPVPVCTKIPIAVGVKAVGDVPKPGHAARLKLRFDSNRMIQELAVRSQTDPSPEVIILGYQPATDIDQGKLELAIKKVETGTGRPGQQVSFGEGPVSITRGQVQLWTLENTQGCDWGKQTDFDASRRTDLHFTLDSSAGQVTFGDGERGRVPLAKVPILISYQSTSGANGSLVEGRCLQLADSPRNYALLGANFDAARTALRQITNRIPVTDGADEEDLDHAAGRAAELLWAHERLVELCPPGGSQTLDQLDRSTVLAHAAPARATTLLDFERLALSVPGARVARVRAWAGIDPNYPGLRASGTVTVVIVPELPASRPVPSRGLLAAVWRYLNRRRVVGTRLVVVGPDYLEVRVRAQVEMRPGADRNRVKANIVFALNTFLDPLRGGPLGRGWPFGRDVYRSEILQVIDNVPGVDHVVSLGLTGGAGSEQCGNLCVGPLGLVTGGEHQIEVR